MFKLIIRSTCSDLLYADSQVPIKTIAGIIIYIGEIKISFVDLSKKICLVGPTLIMRYN